MVALFFAITIIMFLVVDIIYQRVQERKALAGAPEVQTVRPRPMSLNDIRLPEGVFFHPGHTWASILRTGMMKIGVDDLTQRLIGKIDAVELKNVGTEVRQGEPIIQLRQGNKSVELVAPVDGIVERINPALKHNPILLKEDPYSAGWIAMVKPTNIKNSIHSLNIAETAKEWLMQEIQSLKDFLAGSRVEDRLVGQTLQDGGTPVEGVLEYMDENAWSEFQSKFLKN